jgi:hypothetical protein
LDGDACDRRLYYRHTPHVPAYCTAVFTPSLSAILVHLCSPNQSIEQMSWWLTTHKCVMEMRVIATLTTATPPTHVHTALQYSLPRSPPSWCTWIDPQPSGLVVAFNAWWSIELVLEGGGCDRPHYPHDVPTVCAHSAVVLGGGPPSHVGSEGAYQPSGPIDPNSTWLTTCKCGMEMRVIAAPTTTTFPPCVHTSLRCWLPGHGFISILLVRVWPRHQTPKILILCFFWTNLPWEPRDVVEDGDGRLD